MKYLIGFILALFLTQFQNDTSKVICQEHVTVDGYTECSLFTWRGETYTTEFAPITGEYHD